MNSSFQTIPAHDHIFYKAIIHHDLSTKFTYSYYEFENASRMHEINERIMFQFPKKQSSYITALQGATSTKAVLKIHYCSQGIESTRFQEASNYKSMENSPLKQFFSFVSLGNNLVLGMEFQ